MTILPFDEINRMKEEIPIFLNENGVIRSEEDENEFVEELEDLFLLCYASGVDGANDDLGTGLAPSIDEVEATIYQKVAGKVWTERIREYLQSGTIADIERVIDTEAHRITNEAAFDTARKGGARTKTWNCMFLPDSRDTHKVLDGVSAPIDGYFYTYLGNRTMFPGEFGVAEEDVNCQCILTFSR